MDEGWYPDTVTGGNRNIANKDGEAMVASTCTLVAGRMFGGTVPPSSSYVDVAATAAAAATMMTVDATVGLLLLGVILLDSVNMNTDPGKGTTRDDSAIRALLQCTNWSAFEHVNDAPPPPSPSSLVGASTSTNIYPHGRGYAPDRVALFRALSSAKFDPPFWYTLSVTDCLTIDYKKFSVEPPSSSLSVSCIGLSTVLVDMDTLLSRSNFRRDLSEFVITPPTMNDGSCDLYAIMTGCHARHI